MTIRDLARVGLIGLAGAALACSPDVTQPAGPVAMGPFFTVAGPCNNSTYAIGQNTGFGFIKHWDCDRAVGVSLGSTAGLNRTSLEQAITTAVNAWNAALDEDPNLHMPTLVANVGGDIVVNVNNSGTWYCGTTPASRCALERAGPCCDTCSRPPTAFPGRPPTSGR